MKHPFETEQIRFSDVDPVEDIFVNERRIDIPEGRKVTDDDVIAEVLHTLGWKESEVEIACWGAHSMDGIEIVRKDDGRKIWTGVFSELDLVREGGDEAIRALNADEAMVYCFYEIENGDIDPNTGEFPPLDLPPVTEPEWSIQLWMRDETEPAKVVTRDHYWADDRPFVPLGSATVFATRNDALAECDRLNRDRVFPDRVAYPSPRFEWLMKA